MESRFQLGDTVKIAKTSVFYASHEPHNPINVEGRITNIDSSNLVYVTWSLAHTDVAYDDNDLRLVRRYNE